MSKSKKKKRLLSRDFRRNTYFKNLIDKYRKEETGEEKHWLRLEAAEKLGVGLDEFEIMEALGEDFEITMLEDGTELSQTEIDMLKIRDKISDDKYEKLFPTAIPVSRDIAKEMNIIAYPVSIDINKFASRRDLESFIATNWKKIEEILAKYSKTKRVIRSRENEKRDNFLYKYWESEIRKGKNLREIMSDLCGPNKKVAYPGKLVGYSEIQGIIRAEKIRRNKKIV